MANWIFIQTTHVVGLRYSFALGVPSVVLNFKFDQNRISGY